MLHLDILHRWEVLDRIRQKVRSAPHACRRRKMIIKFHIAIGPIFSNIFMLHRSNDLHERKPNICIETGEELPDDQEEQSV